MGRRLFVCVRGRGVVKHVGEGAGALGEALQHYTDLSPMATAAIVQGAQGTAVAVAAEIKRAQPRLNQLLH